MFKSLKLTPLKKDKVIRKSMHNRVHRVYTVRELDKDSTVTFTIPAHTEVTLEHQGVDKERCMFNLTYADGSSEVIVRGRLISLKRTTVKCFVEKVQEMYGNWEPEVCVT